MGQAVEWKPGDRAIAGGGWPVEVIQILPNDWVLVRYEDGGELRWKRWELRVVTEKGNA